MKYVMFTHRKTGLKVPSFFSDHITHSESSVGEDWVATSAGTYDVRSFSAVGQSTSLKMKPAEDDNEICKLVLAGMESMLFLVQDTKKNLRFLEKLLKKRERESKKKSPAAVTIFTPP